MNAFMVFNILTRNSSAVASRESSLYPLESQPTGITIHPWPNPSTPSKLFRHSATGLPEPSCSRSTWRSIGRDTKTLSIGAAPEPQEAEIRRVPQALGKRSRPAIAEPIKPVHAEARTTANRLAGRGKVRRESVHAEHEGIGGNRGSKEGRTRRGA